VIAEPLLRPASPDEAAAIAALAEPVYARFLAPEYDAQGRSVFSAYIAPEAIAERLRTGSRGWVVDAGGQLVGFIETARRHIHLIVVHADWHNRGLARQLIAAATADLGPGIVTLNASPYALPIYERIGFRVTGPQAVRNGIIATPMAMDLK
jgi:GNAT superfamily N-acetyltransferase